MGEGSGAEFAAIRVHGLDRVEASELIDEVIATGVDGAAVHTVEEPDVAGRYGEPTTIVAILAITALKGFIAWLALRQRNQRVQAKLEFVSETGATTRIELDVSVPVGEDAREKVVGALLERSDLPDRLIAQLRGEIGG